MKSSIFILSLLIFCSCKKDKAEFYADANCSDTVSFNDEILPLIQNNCSGCHDNQNGYSLTNHANISSNSSKIFINTSSLIIVSFLREEKTLGLLVRTRIFPL